MFFGGPVSFQIYWTHKPSVKACDRIAVLVLVSKAESIVLYISSCIMY